MGVILVCHLLSLQMLHGWGIINQNDLMKKMIWRSWIKTGIYQIEGEVLTYLLRTEYMDLVKVLHASLWKQMMTDVEGSLSKKWRKSHFCKFCWLTKGCEVACGQLTPFISPVNRDKRSTGRFEKQIFNYPVFGNLFFFLRHNFWNNSWIFCPLLEKLLLPVRKTSVDRDHLTNVLRKSMVNEHKLFLCILINGHVL